MKIAIAGYGAEGISNYRYYVALGHEVTIVDERASIAELPAGAKTILGEGAFGKLQGFDLVVRTAGLAPHKIHTDGKIWSATNEFFVKCHTPIIGVTGSKGKGTTSSLIKSILEAAGKTVALVGNIGVAALDALTEANSADVVVYELSSFQLWDIEKSPHIAVVLMIEPDHLDVHTDFDDYIGAKQNIVRYQHSDDTVIYNRNNQYAAGTGRNSTAQQVAYQSTEAAHVADGYFWYGEQKLCSVEALKLPGLHNQDNACAAIDAAWTYVQDPVVIEQGLARFYGLAHRLKYVATVDEVRYYDDSIATTPGSAIAAMKSFDQPKILIMGGSSKGASFRQVAKTARARDVKHAILIGEEAPQIAQAFELEDVSVTNLGSQVTMPEIVEHARNLALAGDVVILSPACASFGMFKNYADRGDQFVIAVEQLKN